MTTGRFISSQLPYLRRFGRALLGSQSAGDAIVREMLNAMVDEKYVGPNDPREARIDLYRAFLQHVNATERTSPGSAQYGALTELSHGESVALLLTTLEDFPVSEAAQILEIDSKEVERNVANAVDKIDRRPKSKFLILENEPLIAMQLEDLVSSMGHSIAGVASNYSQAMRIMQSQKVDVALVDIQIEGGRSGLDFVDDATKNFPFTPIYITAYPERLLTAARPEPTYLVTKPFQNSTVRAAISQALFFAPKPIRTEDIATTDPKTIARNSKFESVEAPDQQPSTVQTRVAEKRVVLSEELLQTSGYQSDVVVLSTVLHGLANDALEHLGSSNSARFFLHPLAELASATSSADQMVEGEMLKVGVLSDVIEHMISTNDALLDPERLVLSGVARVSRAIADQSLAFRDFQKWSQADPPPVVETLGAIEDVVTGISELPAEVIDPSVVARTESAAISLNEAPTSKIALMDAKNAAINVVSSILKLAKDLTADIRKEVKSQIVEKVATVLISAPMLAAVHLLSPPLAANLTIFMALWATLSGKKATKDD